MISISRTLEVVGMGQYSRMAGMDTVINLPLNYPEKAQHRPTAVGVIVVFSFSATAMWES